MMTTTQPRVDDYGKRYGTPDAVATRADAVNEIRSSSELKTVSFTLFKKILKMPTPLCFKDESLMMGLLVSLFWEKTAILELSHQWGLLYEMY